MSFWNYLPDHILVQIFSFLPMYDRVRAAETCKNWYNSFSSPYLWRYFHFKFYKEQDACYLALLEKFASSIKHAFIELDQFEHVNRENACKLLKKFCDSTNCHLQQINIKFTGKNPLFYAGQEFVTILLELFSKVKQLKSNMKTFQLVKIDFSGLSVLYDDGIFNALAKNHPYLESLNIQNSALVCKVSSQCILYLVQQCRKLKELRIFNCSMSEDILLAFTKEDRVPLEYLGLRCRSEEKYTKDLASNTWKIVADKLPNLKVCLGFDSTCPSRKVSAVMKPEIPVCELRLETYRFIANEIKQAARYYCNTLEKVIINTVSCDETNIAILELSENCYQLNSLHVFCVLNTETVETILTRHPAMKESKRYTLKDYPAPHPWITEDDLNQ